MAAVDHPKCTQDVAECKSEFQQRPSAKKVRKLAKNRPPTPKPTEYDRNPRYRIPAAGGTADALFTQWKYVEN